MVEQQSLRTLEQHFHLWSFSPYSLVLRLKVNMLPFCTPLKSLKHQLNWTNTLIYRPEKGRLSMDITHLLLMYLLSSLLSNVCYLVTNPSLHSLLGAPTSITSTQNLLSPWSYLAMKSFRLSVLARCAYACLACFVHISGLANIYCPFLAKPTSCMFLAQPTFPAHF